LTAGRRREPPFARQRTGGACVGDGGGYRHEAQIADLPGKAKSPAETQKSRPRASLVVTAGIWIKLPRHRRAVNWAAEKELYEERSLHSVALKYLLATFAQLHAIFLQTLLNCVVVAHLFTTKTLCVSRARLLLLRGAHMALSE
jgi:hypothetical protein